MKQDSVTYGDWATFESRRTVAVVDGVRLEIRGFVDRLHKRSVHSLSVGRHRELKREGMKLILFDYTTVERKDLLGGATAWRGRDRVRVVRPSTKTRLVREKSCCSLCRSNLEESTSTSTSWRQQGDWRKSRRL